MVLLKYIKFSINMHSMCLPRNKTYQSRKCCVYFEVINNNFLSKYRLKSKLMFVTQSNDKINFTNGQAKFSSSKDVY